MFISPENGERCLVDLGLGCKGVINYCKNKLCNALDTKKEETVSNISKFLLFYYLQHIIKSKMYYNTMCFNIYQVSNMYYNIIHEISQLYYHNHMIEYLKQIPVSTLDFITLEVCKYTTLYNMLLKLITYL